MLSLKKINIFLVSVLFFFFSCGKEKHKIPDCKEAYKMAASDFKKGKYVYYEYQYITDDKAANEEFINILKKKNIKVIYKEKYPISDVVMPEDKIEESRKCYRIMMNYNMEAKFGHHFFDTARKEAKRISQNSKEEHKN